MKVGKVMKTVVHAISPGATVEQAVRQFVKKKVGTLPVIDDDGLFRGTVVMKRLLNVFLPDFVNLIENVSYLKDYGSLELNSETCNMDIIDKPVESVVELDHSALEEDSGLLAALAIMKNAQVPDLPVLKDGRLVGLVSYVDIGRGILELLQEKCSMETGHES